MLFVQPASGFTWPCTARLGSWQARHNWPFELSRTRKFCATRSIDCTCGSWQLVHSTLPFTSFTAPVASAVLPCETSDAARLAVSFSGVTRLKGCDPVSVVPNESRLYIWPLSGNLPYAADWPTATVPSWQLRHRLLVTPSGGWVLPCW